MWVRWARNKRRLALEARYKRVQNDARFRHMHYVYEQQQNSHKQKEKQNSQKDKMPPELELLVADTAGSGGLNGNKNDFRDSSINGNNLNGGFITPPVTPRGAQEAEGRARHRRNREKDRKNRENRDKDRVKEVIEELEAKERDSPTSPEKKGGSFLDEVRKQKKYVAMGNRRIINYYTT